MFNKKIWNIVVTLCVLAIAALSAAPAFAQMPEVKEKPRMYSYISFWSFPRAQWPEAEKPNMADQKILDKALASGAIVACGNDRNMVHQPDGFTHDDWWSSMSMAGLFNVLDEFNKSGTSTTPLLSSSTRHADNIFVSRYYNWHAGTWKDAYTHGASYKLKPDAPDHALDMLARNMIVPLMEKLLADGTIFEYEIDTEAVHTEAPGTFWVFFITPNAEGLDKANAAIRERQKENPLSGEAFGSVTESSAHRDYISRTNATYK